KKYLSDKGKLEVEEKTDTLIITDVKKNIERIDELVKRMDTLENLFTPPLLDFKEVNLREALRVLSSKTGVNIITSPEVEGKVTASFERPIPFLKALGFILKANNCQYERVDDVIKVSKIPLITTTKSFSLNYALSKEVVREISPLLSKEGKIKVNKETNTLVITETREKMQRIKEAILKIDTLKKQLITRVFPLKFTRAEEVGSLVKTNLTNMGTLKVDSSTNSLLISDTKYNLDKLANIIEGLDVFKPVTKVFSLKFGIAENMAKLIKGYLSPEEKIKINKEKNELIVTAIPHSLDKIGSFIKVNDTFEKQLSEQDFAIKYVKIEKLFPPVKPALSSEGRIKVDPARLILRVKDASYNLYKVGKIIKSLDVFTPEEKFYRIKYAPPSLVATRAKKYLSDKGKLEVEEKTDTLIITDVKKNIERIDELVKRMDTLEDQLITKRYFLKYLTPSEVIFFLRDKITDYGKIHLPEIKENSKKSSKEDHIVIPQEKVSNLKSSGSQESEDDIIDKDVIYVTDLKRNIPEINRAIEEINSASRADEITTKTFYIKEGSLEQVATAIANIIGVKPEEIQGLKVGKEEVKWMKMEVGTPSINLGNIGAVGKK
ncbi:MAG: secretin N-terminal domain-containing protein, partial [Candidatus Aerophobetes bacterium]|nr:secretin N-terminal domain-containing protein [Candidatus Aerophobetes bacterium]